MTNQTIANLSDAELLLDTRKLARRCDDLLADLLVYLSEIEARQLHLAHAYPSMFAFCVGEFGFSEDAACNRLIVARLSRQFPAVLECLRSGRVHLTGLRLLSSHLTPDNHQAVLAEAAGKSKRQIEELIARLAPKPPVPDMIRRLPAPAAPVSSPTLPQATPSEPVRQAVPKSFAVQPLAEETFKVQFTASRALRDKLRQAQDLLGHAVPDGNLAQLVERAMDLLIAEVKKQRFGVGRKERKPATPHAEPVPLPATRHIPDSIKRAVYERDKGRCTFEADGRRCGETRNVEYDHIEGFARTRSHSVETLRLRCAAHNQHAANLMYGRAFMEQARHCKKVSAPGPRGG